MKVTKSVLAEFTSRARAVGFRYGILAVNVYHNPTLELGPWQATYHLPNQEQGIQVCPGATIEDALEALEDCLWQDRRNGLTFFLN